MNSRPVGSMSVVAALPTSFQFVYDSQDVAPIKEHVGEAAEGYDAFFVQIQDGEYIEVWAICGTIPVLSKLTRRIL